MGLGPRIVRRVQLHGTAEIREGTLPHVGHLVTLRIGRHALVEALLIEVEGRQMLGHGTRIRNLVAIVTGHEGVLEVLQVADARLATAKKLLLDGCSQLECRLLLAKVPEAKCTRLDLRLDTDVLLRLPGWLLLAWSKN